MTVIGLLFGFLKIAKNCIEEKCSCNLNCVAIDTGDMYDNTTLSKMGNDCNIHTKINWHFIIECQDPPFRKANAFVHKKIGQSLKMVLNTCHDKKYWHGRDNVFYSIECYHIESQYHLNH